MQNKTKLKLRKHQEMQGNRNYIRTQCIETIDDGH